jgi:hypothetical protein
VTNWALALPPRGGEIAGESTGQSLPLQSLAPRRRQRDGFARVTGSLVVSLRSSDPNEFQSRETGICTVCAPFPSNLRRDTNARRSSLESSLIARDRGDRRGEERWEFSLSLSLSLISAWRTPFDLDPTYFRPFEFHADRGGGGGGGAARRVPLSAI